MDDATKKAACDAFNLLKNAGQLHPEAQYNLVDDTPVKMKNGQVLSNRRAFWLAMEPWLERPDNYSPSKDYVFLWRVTEKHPFTDGVLYEVREFIAAGNRYFFGRTAWQ